MNYHLFEGCCYNNNCFFVNRATGYLLIEKKKSLYFQQDGAVRFYPSSLPVCRMHWQIQERISFFSYAIQYILIHGHEASGEMNLFTLPDLSEFDGTVIFGSGLNFPGIINNIIDRSHSAGIPVIMQGGRHEGAYFIGSDNYLATMEMCAHLEEEHNAKKIIFFAGTVDSHDSEVRLRAVKEYLSRTGQDRAICWRFIIPIGKMQLSQDTSTTLLPKDGSFQMYLSVLMMVSLWSAAYHSIITDIRFLMMYLLPDMTL